MGINWFLLFFVFLVTLLSSIIAIYFLKTTYHKYIYSLFVFGLFFYSGIGVTYRNVPTIFIFYYLFFLIVFSFSFLNFQMLLNKFNLIVHYKIDNKFNNFYNSKIPSYIIYIYIFTFLFPLIYPEFRILDLFNPVMKDLGEVLNESINKNIDFISKIVNYVKLLIMPFFYISLYKFRRNIKFIIMLFITILYLNFITSGYVSRTSFLMYFFIILLFVWREHPKSRSLIAISLFVFAPIFIYIANLYTIIRQGTNPINMNFLEAIFEELKRETSFSLTAGIPIVKSGKNVDLFKYFKWIITLPIPKLFGSFDVARINYDISEIVLGVKPGEAGSNVVLPGLVFESIFIYGKYLFWLHSIFIAGLISVITAILAKTNKFLFLQNYVLFLTFFLLNRAGIASFLPNLVNRFIIFYIFVFLSTVKIYYYKRIS
jgi:hypothetical protein